MNDTVQNESWWGQQGMSVATGKKVFGRLLEFYRDLNNGTKDPDKINEEFNNLQNEPVCRSTITPIPDIEEEAAQRMQIFDLMSETFDLDCKHDLDNETCIISNHDACVLGEARLRLDYDVKQGVLSVEEGISKYQELRNKKSNLVALHKDWRAGRVLEKDLADKTNSIYSDLNNIQKDSKQPIAYQKQREMEDRIRRASQRNSSSSPEASTEQMSKNLPNLSSVCPPLVLLGMVAVLGFVLGGPVGAIIAIAAFVSFFIP